jgi:methylenetetrahydrofolate reductase (NADPH)
MRLGVGQSARILLQRRGLLRKMFRPRPYQPDELVEGLQPCLDDPSIGLRGFHLFSFNAIESTESWRRAALARYQRVA